MNGVAVCKLLGVTIHTWGKWLELGMPVHHLPHTNGNRFIVSEVFAWREQQAEMSAEAGGYENTDHMDIKVVKKRTEIAKMVTAELDLAIKRGQLIEISTLMENFSVALVNVRSSLVSLPSRMSGILAHQDEDAIVELLDKEVLDTLTNLSEYKHVFKDSDHDNDN